MGITAQRLKELELIDFIVPEPLGGAHRDVEAMARTLKHSLIESLDAISLMPVDRLLEQRYERLSSFGNYQEK